MAAQESQAKIKVVLDTKDAESVLERMNESLGGGRGPGQGATGTPGDRAPGAGPTAGRGAARGGGGTNIVGGGAVGKLSQIIKLLAIVAVVSKIMEPVLQLAKQWLETTLNKVHQETGLDKLAAEAEFMSEIRVMAEAFGQSTLSSEKEVGEYLRMMESHLRDMKDGKVAGARAATDFNLGLHK